MLRLGKYLEQNNLYNSDNKDCLMPALFYDITPSVFSASKVATLTQVKAIYSQVYYHMCISVSQLVSNIGIAEFAGIAVLASEALGMKVDEKLAAHARIWYYV